MEIKIGVLTLQSKAVPRMSKSFMNGLRLALASTDIDAKFFIEGVGDGTDVNLAVEKMEKLVMQEEVQLIVGMIGHRSETRMRAAAQDLWLPVIMSGYGATMPVGWKKGESYFSLSLDRWHSSYLLGGYLVEKGFKEVGVSAAYYDCGYGLVEGLERGLYGAGGSFLGHYVVPHQPREDEAEIFIDTVKGMNDSPLFAAHSGVFALEYAESMKALGDKKAFPMYATPETLSDEVLEKFGELYLGTKTVTSWAKELDTPENKEFLDKYTTKFKKVPDDFSLLGYESGLAVVAALKLVDEDTMDEDALIAALAKMETEGPRGKLKFSEELNRSINDHHLFEVTKADGVVKLKPIETITSNPSYYSEVCKEEDDGKRGGWFNAYLCH